MKMIKTAAVWAGIITSALVAWAVFLPSAQPILDRAGLLEPMRAMGIPLADAASDAGGGRPGFGGGATRVVAQELTLEEYGDRLGAIGTAEAMRSVIITPDVGGRLSAVYVQSGDRVAEGDLIAEIDPEIQQLAVRRAELALQDARDRANRVAQLRDSGTASQVQIDDAAIALNRAELDLQEAQFELSRRRITAPFGGYVCLVSLQPGNQLSAGSEVATLDDRERLRVLFDVPERLVGLIEAGDTFEISPLSRPQDRFEGKVRAVDARVRQADRSLRVEGEIDNSDDRLRPGMAFRVTVVLPGEYYPAIDPLMVQWDRRGAFVWAIADDNTAQRVGVEIVQRRDDTVLVRAALEAGDRVVLEGVQNLRPGAPVEIAELRPAASTAEQAQARDTTPDI
jgi:RND family efflux transporter MFP subunit